MARATPGLLAVLLAVAGFAPVRITRAESGPAVSPSVWKRLGASRERVSPSWLGFAPPIARQGAVVQALGLPTYVTKAAGSAHKLRRAAPNAKVALFTDRETLENWQSRAERALMGAARRRPKPGCEATSTDNACAAPAPEAAVDLFGALSPFDYIAVYDGEGGITVPEIPRAAEQSRWQKSGSLWARKIATYQHTPFNHTLFTDSDACACYARGQSRLKNLKGLIGKADFVTVMDDKGHGGTPPPPYDPKRPVPMEFDERNGGFNMYKQTRATEALFRAWMEVFLWHAAQGDKLPKVTHDQPALREALYVATQSYGLKEALLPNRGKGGICRGFDKEQKMRCEGMTWSQFFRRQGESYACAKPTCGREESVKAKAYAIRAARRVLAREHKGSEYVDKIVDSISDARRSAQAERLIQQRRANRNGYPMGPGCEDGCLAVHEKCECWKRRAEDVRLERRRDLPLRLLTRAAREVFAERGDALTHAGASSFPWSAIDERLLLLARASASVPGLSSSPPRFLRYDASAGSFAVSRRP